MSQVDQKRAFNKMKHSLEPWRNLIVHVDSLLTWEKNFYPAIIFGGISLFFLIIWIINLSAVTMLALTGFYAIAFNYAYPSVSGFLCNPENWTSSREVQYERVCGQLCTISSIVGAWYEYLFNSKERKSTVFVIVMSVVLLALAYIGAIINNLLLMYILVMSLAMYPGIQEKNLLKVVKERFGFIIKSKVDQLREKGKKEE